MLWSQFMRKPLASTCWRLLSRLHLQVWVFVSVSAGVCVSVCLCVWV